MFKKLASLHKEHRQLQQNRPSYLFSILSASLVAHVKLSNSARKSIQIFWAQTFSNRAYSATCVSSELQRTCYIRACEAFSSSAKHLCFVSSSLLFQSNNCDNLQCILIYSGPFSSHAIEPKNEASLWRGARGRYDHFLMILLKLGSGEPFAGQVHCNFFEIK